MSRAARSRLLDTLIARLLPPGHTLFRGARHVRSLCQVVRHATAAVVLASAAVSAALAAELSDADRQIPFALAVRGGVSLGSYEAGFEWALLEYLKSARAGNRTADRGYVDLVATSGASAGSINALMSTLSWCIDPAKSRDRFPDSVSDNVLFDTWLGIGFEELLPEKVDSTEYYRSDDGVLTRNAFRDTVARLRHILSTDSFIPGCEVRFGVLVTRVDPAEKEFAGIRVHNQRFVIPLRLHVGPWGYARFVGCLVDDEDPAFGNVMYLQGTPTGEPACPLEHDTDAIIDAIEASSAFPVAFGRKILRYCEPYDEDVEGPGVSGESDRCPQGMQPVLDEFIDGGLFDNIPLGLARALAEPDVWDGADGRSEKMPGRRFNYIYLDPTIRRNVGSDDESATDTAEAATDEEDEEVAEETFGLRSQMRFFFGAVTSGRDYELYNLLRSGEWTNQVFAISDRLAEAVSARYPNLRIVQPQLEGLQTMMPRCEQWFADNFRPADESNRDAVATAIQCIVTGVYLLEQQYRGTPIEQQLHSGDEITRERNQLLEWITALAIYIGEDRLVMNARLAMNDSLGDRRILLSSRFSPVVGEMMSAFGGFVDRSFREYDYYAGVYDAIWGIANFVCERQLDRGACIAAQLQRIHEALGIRESQPAHTVFDYLLHQEFGKDSGFVEAFAWANGDFVKDENMLAIANSLFGDPETDGGAGNVEPTMTEFIARLVEQEYDTSNSSDFLKRIFRLKNKNELTWYYPLTLRASNRLLLLEHRESKARGGGEFLKAGLALGAFYLHSYMREEEITLNVSTAPDFAWQAWLPDEVAIDARNGGLDLSWYQGRQITESGWRWDVKLTPIQLTHSNQSRADNLWFSQADVLVSRRTHGKLTAFGFGPSVFYTWDTWPSARQTTIGAVLYIGFIEDKFRVSIGKSSFKDRFAGANYYLNIGVNDVPGLAYWGWSGSRRSWWPFATD